MLLPTPLDMDRPSPKKTKKKQLFVCASPHSIQVIYLLERVYSDLTGASALKQ